MSTTCENYLHDIGRLLKERAEEECSLLVRARSEDLDSDEIAFRLGRAMAYYEVLNTMFHQADLFQPSLRGIGFSESDVDKLLKCM